LWYWDVVFMTRNMFIALIVTMQPDNGYQQIFLLQTFVVVISVPTAMLSPWRSDVNDRGDVLVNTIMVLGVTLWAPAVTVLDPSVRLSAITYAANVRFGLTIFLLVAFVGLARSTFVTHNRHHVYDAKKTTLVRKLSKCSELLACVKQAHMEQFFTVTEECQWEHFDGAFEALDLFLFDGQLQSDAVSLENSARGLSGELTETARNKRVVRTITPNYEAEADEEVEEDRAVLSVEAYSEEAPVGTTEGALEQEEAALTSNYEVYEQTGTKSQCINALEKECDELRQQNEALQARLDAAADDRNAQAPRDQICQVEVVTRWEAPLVPPGEASAALSQALFAPPQKRSNTKCISRAASEEHQQTGLDTAPLHGSRDDEPREA
jgi:hypothetical protein